ncbi:MAG: FAD-dependent oxidoreductase [Candidatus Liptonbacteria bacterium]|nr:FAD-dependent oxidoreductase [Candidatus Liptonbacteria bacterium]
MAFHKIKFIKREEIADGTMAFHFEKPTEFEFKAGQFVEMTLLNPAETDAEGNNRAFSIASAPCEPELTVAMRMRDTAFKRILKTLPAGAEAQIEGPFGDFTLHSNVSRPAVFLMGGIGITPARSIVVEAAQKKLSHKIFLFYSNRQPKDAAFFQELKNLELKNQNYKFIPTMTDVADGDFSWVGERGYIDNTMLKKYLGDLQGSIYYSAGPQAMVAAMRKTLNNAGVDDDDIKTEEFSGY